jgi:DNA-binding NarL/FixJ family response regulator
MIEQMYLYERIFLAIRSWFRPRSPRNFTLEVETLRTLQHIARQSQRTPEEMAQGILGERLHELWLREENLRRWEKLTAREQQVAALICSGYTTRQIAARLKIRPETVKTYAEGMLAKFKVRDRKALRRMLQDWDFSAWDP